jgi:CRP-like cAMP-binding protein
MGSTKSAYVEVPAGSAVFKEGEVGGELYIIESGQVELIPRSGAPLGVLGAGDFFGEMALLEKQPHTTTALAKADTRLLRIDAAMLPDVLGQNGAIGAALLRQLAERALRIEQRLRETGIEFAALKAFREPPPPSRAADAPTPVRNTKSESLQVTQPPPALIALHVTGADKTIALDPARTDFLIGRPDPLTGAVPDIDLGSFDGNRTLSRRHARLLRDGGAYFVREDSATTNGTHVNGARLQTGVSVPIKPGDKLYFGSIEVEVVAA